MKMSPEDVERYQRLCHLVTVTDLNPTERSEWRSLAERYTVHANEEREEHMAARLKEAEEGHRLAREAAAAKEAEETLSHQLSWLKTLNPAVSDAELRTRWIEFRTLLGERLG